MLPTRKYFYKDTNRWKVKEKKINHNNYSKQSQSSHIHIKVDFRAKTITKESYSSKDVTTLNVYAPNNTASK